jgi:hypothetical protein
MFRRTRPAVEDSIDHCLEYTPFYCLYSAHLARGRMDCEDGSPGWPQFHEAQP